MTKTFHCPECDYAHEIAIVRGETAYDDYVEIPAVCDGCGESFETLCSVTDDRKAERQQMGIVN